MGASQVGFIFLQVFRNENKRHIFQNQHLETEGTYKNDSPTLGGVLLPQDAKMRNHAPSRLPFISKIITQTIHLWYIYIYIFICKYLRCIYYRNKPNVGKSALHGRYGRRNWYIYSILTYIDTIQLSHM